MKIKKLSIGALLLSAMLLFCACAQPAVLEKQAKNLMQGVAAQNWPDPPETLSTDFTAPLMNFSWNLLKQSLNNEGGVLISPVSIYLALAMTQNGADAETLTAMKQALSAQDLTEEELNAACRDLISLLGKKTEKTQVSLANSIWVRQDFSVAANFLQKNADYFAAAAQTLNFDSPAAVGTINGWVKDNTGGKIQSIIDQINADTVMYLINAVYFKSDWQTPFNAAKTNTGYFAAQSGQVEADFMNREGEMQFIDKNGVTGVLLPYEDGRYTFFALLPEEGRSVRDYVDSLDGAQIAALIASMKSGQVALSLPKFEVVYSDSMKDELSAMGMGVAFTDQANLSRIGAGGANNLLISDVVHKTFCRVDEKGTEAAAVTAVEVSLSAMPLDNTVISFDRPFVYGIVDADTGSPLFLGVMENPAA